VSVLFTLENRALCQEPNSTPALPHPSERAGHVSFLAHTTDNREIRLCLKKLSNIIAKHPNTTAMPLVIMTKQPSTMRAGNTRKPPITLTLPAVTRATPGITLTTPAKRIPRSTGRNNLRVCSPRRFRRGQAAAAAMRMDDDNLFALPPDVELSVEDARRKWSELAVHLALMARRLFPLG
jgi:hypothetical protein